MSADAGKLVRVFPDGREELLSDPPPLPRLSDDGIGAAALGEPDNPADFERQERLERVPRVKVMRRALGLTQRDFSTRFRIPLWTLRDWEQGKRQPDQAARAYLP